MKTELRLAPHTVLPGANVIEIWYHGHLIGQVTGAEGPGVRVFSKYQIESHEIASDRATPVYIIEVVVGPT